MSVLYRTRQFLFALTASPSALLVEEAFGVLSAAEMALFESLQASEQSHSLEVFKRLVESGQNDHDLLVAALLHDVGKSRYPLRLWERVVIVLFKHFMPVKVKTWGNGSPLGWKRLFVVSEQHAAWGAEMIDQAGGSERSVSLVRRHQQVLFPVGHPQQLSYEDCLLIQLQRYDNES